MSDFGTTVDIVCAVIGAASIFLIFFGELASRWIRARRENS